MAQTHQGDFVITKNLTVGTEGGTIQGELAHSISGSPDTVQYEIELLKDKSSFGGIVENYSELPAIVAENDIYFVKNSITLPLQGASAGANYVSQGLNENTILYMDFEDKDLSTNTIYDKTTSQKQFYTTSPLGSDYKKFDEFYIDFNAVETGGTNDNGRIIEKIASGEFRDIARGTIGFWFRPNSTPSQNGRNYVICGFSRNEFYIEWDKAIDNFIVYSKQGVLATPVNSGTAFNQIPLDFLNAWHNVIITWNETVWEMYVDGKAWGKWEVAAVKTYATATTKKFAFGNIPLNTNDLEGIDFPVDELFVEPSYFDVSAIQNYYSNGAIVGKQKSGWHKYQGGTWTQFQATDPHIVTAENVSYDDTNIKEKLDTLLIGNVGILKDYVATYDELPSDAATGNVYLVGNANEPQNNERGNWTTRSDMLSQMEAITEADDDNNYQVVLNSDLKIHIGLGDLTISDTGGFIGRQTLRGNINIHPLNEQVDFIGNKTAGTVMFWVKSDDIDSDNAIFSFAYPTAVNYGRDFHFKLQIEEREFGEKVFRLFVGNDTNGSHIVVPNTNSPILTNATFFDDAFHHIAIVWTALGWKIYLDGAVYDSFANTEGMVPLAINSSTANFADQPDLVFYNGNADNQFREIICSIDTYTQSFIEDYVNFTPITEVKSPGFYRKDTNGFIKLEVDDPFGVLENINIDLIPVLDGIDIGAVDHPYDGVYGTTMYATDVNANTGTFETINVNEILPVATSASNIGTVAEPFNHMYANVVFAGNVMLSGSDKSVSTLITQLSADQDTSEAYLLNIINTNIQDISGLGVLLAALDARVAVNENNITGLQTNVGALQTDVSELSATGMSHHGRITTLETQVATNIQDINTNETDISHLSTLVDDISGTVELVAELESDIITLTNTVNNNTSSIGAVNTSILDNATNINTVALNVTQNSTSINNNSTDVAQLQFALDTLITEGISGGGATFEYVDENDTILQQQLDVVTTNIADISGANNDVLGVAPQGSYDGPSSINSTDLDSEAVYKLDKTLSYLLPPEPANFPNGYDVGISGTLYAATLANNANVPNIGANGSAQSWYDSPVITFNGQQLGNADKGRYVLEVYTNPASGFLIVDEFDLAVNFDEDNRDALSGQSAVPLSSSPLGLMLTSNIEWYSSNPGVIPHFPTYQVADLDVNISNADLQFADERTNSVRVRHDVDFNLSTAHTSNALQFSLWTGFDTGDAPALSGVWGEIDSPPNTKYISGVQHLMGTSTFSLSASMTQYSNNVYQDNMLTVSTIAGFAGDALVRSDFGLITPSLIDEVSTTAQTYSFNVANVTYTGNATITATPLAYTRNGTPVNINLGDVILDTNPATNDTATTRLFKDEQYRIIKGDYTVFGDIASGAWDSTNSIGVSATTDYEDALLIQGDQLKARNIDFTAYLPHGLGAVVNPNLSGYSSGDAYYTYFTDAAAYNNGKFTVSGVTGAQLGSTFNIYIKLPGNTDWMDMNDAYSGSGPADAVSSGPLLEIVGNDIMWTLGTKHTGLTNNTVVVKIEFININTVMNTFSITWI